MVKRSSKPCVGCAWRPSPALTTWTCVRPIRFKCAAIRCGAPDCEWRTTNMSAFIATRLSTVSSSVSPLLVDDTPMLRLITSADSRFAAISNVVRVRVEFSKNRLNTERPRSSGTFFTSRSAIDANGTAVSSTRRMISGGSPSSVRRCVKSPAALSCGLRTACLGAERELAFVVARQHDREIARDGKTDAGVRRLDGELASAAIHQHRELDARRPAVIEELVHGRANAAPRVENVVDQ